MSTRIERHTKVSGPKRFVYSREVDTHLIECLNKVVSWFDSQVSHSAEPIIHSFDSPVTIRSEEKIVSTDEHTSLYSSIIYHIIHMYTSLYSSISLYSTTQKFNIFFF